VEKEVRRNKKALVQSAQGVQQNHLLVYKQLIEKERR